MLDQHGHLAIAILTLYALGLPIAVFVCARHGFTRALGWLYLIFLPVVRIAGAGCEIAAESISPPKNSLYIAAAVLNSVGLVPLLLCLMGLLQRVNNSASDTFITPQIFRITHLVLIVGLALAIAGGVEIDPTNSASEIKTGNNLRKVSAILLLVGWLASLGFNALLLFRQRTVWEGDRKLIYFGLAAEPLLLLRLVYLLCICFATHSTTFSTFAPNIWAQAFMQVLPEFLVFSLFLTAGILTAEIIRRGGLVEDAPTEPLGQPWGKYQQDTELGPVRR